MKFKKITHVIFDMDGLLLESESIYNRILGDIAQIYGKTYDYATRMKVLGKTEPDVAKTIINELNLPVTLEDFLADYRMRVKKQLTHPEFMPGAVDLVKHLHKNNIPIAVATSSSEESVKIKTQNYQDFFSLFHHVVCGSTDPEVKHGKPAPDIFLVCGSRFPDKPHPEQCLVFEDAPNGVEGAIAAGMQAVLVPSDEITQDMKKSATLVINSLKEFQPELFDLPSF